MTIKMIIKDILFEIECSNSAEACEFIHNFVENNPNTLTTFTYGALDYLDQTIEWGNISNDNKVL